MQPRTLCGAGALLLTIGVAAGAFGAHALKAIHVDLLAVWHTAVLYQLVHGLGLIALAAAHPLLQPRTAALAGPILLAGSVLFSFSLYALVMFQIPFLAYLTPLGGLLMVAGWALVVVAAWTRPRS
ncbi:DUF423 domain-containing protein [Alcaligenaceae bacterium 429]|nr:DUF423 domain-containing protein [Alcaligenaceae bacterium 429]